MVGTETHRLVTGCKFAERCQYVRDICRTVTPPVVSVQGQRTVLCFRPVDYAPVGQAAGGDRATA